MALRSIVITHNQIACYSTLALYQLKTYRIWPNKCNKTSAGKVMLRPPKPPLLNNNTWQPKQTAAHTNNNTTSNDCCFNAAHHVNLV